MLFDELKCWSHQIEELSDQYVSLLSFFSHLVYNALGILLWYSEAVVRIIRKIYRKTTVPDSFYNKVPGRLKKRVWTVFFKNTSGRLLWKLSVFSRFFLAVLYTHSRNNWNFSRKVYFSNNWALFAAHVWFLYYKAKACWWVQHDETTIILTKYSCKREHYEN